MVHSAADVKDAEFVAHSLRPHQVDLIDIAQATATDLEQPMPYIALWSGSSSSSPDFRTAMEAAHDRYSLVSVITGRSVVVPVRFRSSLALKADQLRGAQSSASAMLQRQLDRAWQQMLPAPFTQLGLDEIRAVIVSGVDRRGLDLAHRELGGLDLRNGCLNGASLLRTDLSECRLDNVRLVGANLERCTLTGSRICDADLRFANLWHAEMTRVEGVDTCDFTHANTFGTAGLGEAFLPRSFSRGSYAAYIQYFILNLAFTMNDVYESFPWLTHKYFEHLLA